MLERMSRVDLQTYLLELLMKQDQMSMAASIESRVPFLDDHLVEHVAAMPGRLKLRGWQTKAVLRAAVRISFRRRSSRAARWDFRCRSAAGCAASFWPVVDEFVLGTARASARVVRPHAVRQLVDEHRGGRARHGDRLWLLVNLEIWHRIFCDGETSADVMRAIRANVIKDLLCESSG